MVALTETPQSLEKWTLWTSTASTTRGSLNKKLTIHTHGSANWEGWLGYLRYISSWDWLAFAKLYLSCDLVTHLGTSFGNLQCLVSMSSCLSSSVATSWVAVTLNFVTYWKIGKSQHCWMRILGKLLWTERFKNIIKQHQQRR